MASTASVQPHLSNCSIAHQTVYNNPNALDIDTRSTQILKLSAPLTGSWSALKGYTFMTASSYPIAAPCDWLYDTANWWTTNGPTNVYPDAPYGRPQIIVWTMNGDALLVGEREGADMTAGTLQTGGAMGDLYGYSLTFTGQEQLPAAFISGSTTSTAIPTSVLNGGTIVYGTNS